MRVLVGLLLLLLCARQSAQRAEVWQSDVALWSAALDTSPNLPRPAVNLALAYGRADRWPEAVAMTERAILLTESPSRFTWMHDQVCRLRAYVTVFGEPGEWPAWCSS